MPINCLPILIWEKPPLFCFRMILPGFKSCPMNPSKVTLQFSIKSAHSRVVLTIAALLYVLFDSTETLDFLITWLYYANAGPAVTDIRWCFAVTSFVLLLVRFPFAKYN